MLVHGLTDWKMSLTKSMNGLSWSLYRANVKKKPKLPSVAPNTWRQGQKFDIWSDLLISKKKNIKANKVLEVYLTQNHWQMWVVECFSPLLECSSRFLRALQQERAQSRLLYLFYKKESVKFPKQTPKHYFQFSKQTLSPKRTTASSACSIPS